MSELFPHLFSITRPIATPDVPVVVAASILTTYEFPIVPMTKGDSPTEVEREGVKLFKAIGGLQIIRLVVDSKPADYSKVLWEPATTATIWLGALDYSESLERLLRVFELTGFGDARVNAPTPPHALITLDEVVSLYQKRKLGCKVEAEAVASRAIFVDPDARLIDAMRMMCTKRVRRLFLRGRPEEFISDRLILAYLFSSKALGAVRESPDLWTDVEVSEIPSMKATLVSPHTSVEDVGCMVDAGHDVFMLSDGFSLLSKWDLVMKPWKAKKLSLLA